MTHDVSSLARLDSFPYRHRLAEVMEHPVLTARREITLAEACDRMNAGPSSALVVVDDDGRMIGIITERDVLSAFSRLRATAFDMPLAELMSSPVQALPETAFLYAGIARMVRLGLRHLVVVDDADRPVGVVTGRTLLKVRASHALVIGDELSQAQSAADMAHARTLLPDLAAGLLAEDVSARVIAAVIGSVVREMTGRAAQMAESALLADGWGPPPARWAALILGSGGRGESLLAFDQDNAIVHAGNSADDAWYVELGRRMNDILNAAGIPYCIGEVMARNPIWCHSLDDWKSEIRRWVFEPQLQTVMYVDIFFDFALAHGDVALARELKQFAVDTAGQSGFFLQFLCLNVSQMDVPLSIFGGLATDHGRLNAKKLGLLPLVSAARAKALAAGIAAAGTAERYAALTQAGLMHADDLASLLAAHEVILRAVLLQQLADIRRGLLPSSQVEPGKLPRPLQRQLKAAFQRIRTLKTLIGSLMAG
jgi:signal-transduction protein with cAMP-binding, CBS, and nucleotidyltransferase domain